MRIGIEIACFSLQSARIATCTGADRIELCADRDVGGVTPTVPDLKWVKNMLSTVQAQEQRTDIPVFVMIRPRGGDFVYSDTEFTKMRQDIGILAGAGANGFVFGILTAEGDIDMAKNKELVALADGRPCTFHRAFDGLSNMSEGLEQVIACGFSNILTAGSSSRQGAVSGVAAIRDLIARANGRINIIPGGGVRSDNIGSLRGTTGATYYHSSAIVGSDEEASALEVKRLIDAVR